MGHDIQGLIQLTFIYLILGILLAFDGYMNLQLINAEEWIDGKMKGNVG